MRDTEQDQIRLAAEDQFLIVSLGEGNHLLPSAEDASALGGAIEMAKPYLGGLTPIFDARGLPKLYTDVVDFLAEASISLSDPQVLVPPHMLGEFGLGQLQRACGMKVFPAAGAPRRGYDLSMASLNPYDRHWGAKYSRLDRSIRSYLPHRRTRLTSNAVRRMVEDCFTEDDLAGVKSAEVVRSLELFLPEIESALPEGNNRDEPDWEKLRAAFMAAVREEEYPPTGIRMIGSRLPDVDEEDLDHLLDSVSPTEQWLRPAFLHARLRHAYERSVLVEYVLSTSGEHVAVSPYCSGALHNVAAPSIDSPLIGRPALFARRTTAMFRAEIGALEVLINSPGVRELDLQRFFERYPAFLRGLNYASIYPQLVLQRHDASTLRPDFILEPCGGEWCDILELKLPEARVTVGRGDATALSAAVLHTVEQLRKYSEYFDDERHRRWVRNRYGLSVCKPRLIALIGRDMRDMNDGQRQQAITKYCDVEVLTFDRLIEHAKSRLLV